MKAAMTLLITSYVGCWGNLVAFGQRMARLVALRRRPPITFCWHIWHHCAILVASIHNRGRSSRNPGGDRLPMRIGQRGQQRLDIVTAVGAHIELGFASPGNYVHRPETTYTASTTLPLNARDSATSRNFQETHPSFAYSTSAVWPR